MNKRSAILLLSGGMDSTTLLGKLLIENWNVHPVIFDYGQKHRIIENEAAKNVWNYYKREYSDQLFPYKIIKLDLTQIGNSALTDLKINVPDNMEEQSKTVVAHRNALMTTLAAAYGESIGVCDIFITPVKDDEKIYYDCRPIFYKTLSAMLSASANKSITVHTPFIDWWKKDIVAWGIKNNIPFHLSRSCYAGLDPACGVCPADRERLAAFVDNKIDDPIPYATIPATIPCISNISKDENVRFDL